MHRVSTTEGFGTLINEQNSRISFNSNVILNIDIVSSIKQTAQLISVFSDLSICEGYHTGALMCQNTIPLQTSVKDSHIKNMIHNKNVIFFKNRTVQKCAVRVNTTIVFICFE